MSPPHEPTVRPSAPMPAGYTFVPKGNVYMTSHCRKQTQASSQTVFVVVVVVRDTKPSQKRVTTLGIRVPTAIFTSVQASHDATRSTRAEAVRRRDTKLETEFRAAVLARFPQAPPASLALVVDRAMRKGSRRVGRAGSEGLAVEDKAVLAVRAHIRHAHTEYDSLLRGGMMRDQARAETYGRIDEVVGEWGGKPSMPKPKAKAKPEKRARRRRRQQQRDGGRSDRPQKQDGEKSARAAMAVVPPRKTVAVRATAIAVEKSARGCPRKPEEAAAITPESASRLRREKKQVVRRTRETAAARGESPEEVPREPVQLRTRSGRRYSLLDDGDDESDEFDWSNWDEDEDEDDEDDIYED